MQGSRGAGEQGRIDFFWLPCIPCAIPKAHTPKLHPPHHRPRKAGRILVQLRLAVDEVEDAPRAGHAQRDARIGHQRDVGREAEQPQQPHVGHHVADLDASRLEQQQGVGKAQRLGQAQQQQRQELGLLAPLGHGGVAVFAGVGLEAGDLGRLLGAALDHLHAVQRLGQTGVHRAEGQPHAVGDVGQHAHVVGQGDHVGDDEEQRRGDQLRVVARGQQQGHDHEVGRADDEIDARVQHQVHLTHVVGGAGHCVADRLQVVEGHALAQQAQVEFLPRVALHPFADDRTGEVAPQLQHRARHLTEQDAQGHQRDAIEVRRVGQRGVEGDADEDGHGRRQRRVAQCADKHGHEQPAVPAQMRQNPATGRTDV